MSVAEPSSARLVATLAGAGLLSGLALVGLYVGTLPRIQQNRAAALERAILHVLPGAATFEAMEPRGAALEVRTGESVDIVPGEVLYRARDAGGAIVGYAIPADGPGFMDTITLLYGYDPARGHIVGMEVLESRETPGLGDKIIHDPRFLENFTALVVRPTITAVKRGDKTEANQVDCITGATISSKAVVNILNRSVERWSPHLAATPETR